MNESHCGVDMTAIEFPEVYDGVSAYICEQCGHWQHRWPEGHYRRAKTESEMRRFRAGYEMRERRAKGE